jgi:hypothetical protein
VGPTRVWRRRLNHPRAARARGAGGRLGCQAGPPNGPKAGEGGFAELGRGAAAGPRAGGKRSRPR